MKYNNIRNAFSIPYSNKLSSLPKDKIGDYLNLNNRWKNVHKLEVSLIRVLFINFSYLIKSEMENYRS